MLFKEAIADVRVLSQWGDPLVEVLGVQYDSRRVGPGDVFVAMRGGTTDGNKFVAKALELGASAVVTDSAETAAELESQGVTVALVEHGRRALAEVSAAVFGHPERKLKVSAVTGTNGKTTTAFLLQQMLRSVGRKVVLLGTIETRIGDEVRESAHTTPESRDLYEIFAEGVRAGCTEVVMEMSSHALEQERVWGVPVDVAMFTNLTQDHLDYHGTMGAYARAKAKLFEGVGVPAPRVAVINRNSPYKEMMIQAASGCSEIVTYQIGYPLELISREQWGTKSCACSAEGTEIKLLLTFGEGVLIQSKLVGVVNVMNLLAAMAAAKARGLSMDEIAAAVLAIHPAPGRFESVPNTLGITVVVDYAHTDDALENLIQIARDLLDHSDDLGGGRVITMFGCGGDRDRTKRPKMGRVAAEGSDVVVVTSDNPRSEEPAAIVEEVMVGVREAGRDAVIVLDRHQAIERAIHEARPGDIVLLAGKGHEKTQTFADRTVAFDDVAVAAEVLRGLK